MNVAINHQGAFDLVVFLQAANGDGDVVDHAEALAVVGEGMMKSSAEADADAVLERAASGENGTAGVAPKRLHQFLGVGNFHLQFFAGAERAGLQLVNPVGAVDQEDVAVIGFFRNDKIGGLGDAALQQPVMDEAVLGGGKHVLPIGR